MQKLSMRLTGLCLSAVLCAVGAGGIALGCTRTLFVGADDTVITGRNMDWKEDMSSNLWVFPAGLKRDGAAGARSIRWVSKYGSVIVSGYEVGTADGLNEKGLAANLLYLAESEYPKPDGKRPVLSIAAWTQYALDNYATVDEAVSALAKEPFNLLAPTLPNGAPAALHLSISDASGDSAIFEYVKGKLIIHHGKQYKVMTNSPTYDQQLAIEEYWRSVGGLAFLPGTNRAADRFARAAFLLDAIPKKHRPALHQGRAGAVLRLSGGGERVERAARGQRAAGDFDARSTQYCLDDLARRGGPEESHLLFRLRHAAEHILGLARQAEPQTGSAGQETHDPERRGVLGRSRGAVQGRGAVQIPAGVRAVGVSARGAA